MSIVHAKSITIADATGTLTVGNFPNTSTVAATDVQRPSDWNSGHNLIQEFAGNTAGVSSISGTNIVFAGGSNITLSATSDGLGGATFSIIGASGGGGLALSANGSSQSAGTVVLSNSNNVSFGMNASTITASAVVNLSAGTTSNNLSNVVFSNSNNVSFGLNGSTITASVSAAAGNTISYFDNYTNLANTLASQSWFAFDQSTSFIMPFVLPAALSAAQVRIPANVSVGQGNTQGTTANTTVARGFTRSYYVGIYAQGTGASSQSLSLLASSSAAWQQVSSIQANANGSEYTMTQQITYFANGSTIGTSTSNASSQTNFRFFSSLLGSNIDGTRMFDIPFGSSLPQSNLWLAVGGFSSTSSNAAGIPSALADVSAVMIAGINSQFQLVGEAATASSNVVRLGQGRFSSTTAGMPSLLPLSAISSSTSQPAIGFALMRQA